MGLTSGQAIARDLRAERGGGAALSTLELQVIARIGDLTDQRNDLRTLRDNAERARLLARINGQLGRAQEQLRQLDRRAERFKPAPDRPPSSRYPDTPLMVAEELARKNAEYALIDPAGYAEMEWLFGDGSGPDPGGPIADALDIMRAGDPAELPPAFRRPGPAERPATAPVPDDPPATRPDPPEALSDDASGPQDADPVDELSARRARPRPVIPPRDVW